jgi:hypothetical protein
MRPCSITCSFISSATGQTPLHSHGRNLWPFAETVAGSRISGESLVTSGALSRKASTSASVIPTADSAKCLWSAGKSRGSTRTLSSPPIAMSASFAPFSMPAINADIATRLETPRMIPSIVSNERNLCAQISRNPVRRVIPNCDGLAIQA